MKTNYLVWMPYKPVKCIETKEHKKVLLRERKRHTARRVAIASPCYSGERGGSLDKNFSSQSEHVSSQIWCQKFFPLLGGVPRQNFFFWSEHVSSQIWCQKFFPLLGGGSLDKTFFSGLNMYQAKSGVKNFSLYWDWVPPLDLRPGTPPDLRLGTPPGPETRYPLPPGPGPGTPPTWTWTWEPHLGVDWQTENSTFPHPSDAGGKYDGTTALFTYWWLHCKTFQFFHRNSIDSAITRSTICTRTPSCLLDLSNCIAEAYSLKEDNVDLKEETLDASHWNQAFSFWYSVFNVLWDCFFIGLLMPLSHIAIVHRSDSFWSSASLPWKEVLP